MNCLISIAKTNYMTISPNIPIIVNAGSNPVPSNKQVTATEPRSATSIIKLPMPSEEAAAQMLIGKEEGMYNFQNLRKSTFSTS
jgi:hypothetical protein